MIEAGGRGVNPGTGTMYVTFVTHILIEIFQNAYLSDIYVM